MVRGNDDLPDHWPRMADHLFAQNCWAFDASLSTFRGERMYRMKKASRNAGDLLVAHTADNAHERDNLVWPIVFCYRQYIELALKDVIAIYGPKADPRIEPNWNTHKLGELWKPYKQILLAITSDDIPEVLAVEACIAEFDEIDVKSYAFRFPNDKKGEQVDIPLDFMDLYNLQCVMESIYAFFDATESALDVHFNPPCG